MADEPKPRPRADTLTVVEVVYHQQFGEQPTSIEHRFDRQLATSEQPYQRRLRASEEWLPLPTGWLPASAVGMMVISNDEGRGLALQPSSEEKEEIAGKILEVSYNSAGDGGKWLIHPGETMRGYPDDAGGLYIRCRRDTARFTLYLYPA